MVRHTLKTVVAYRRVVLDMLRTHCLAFVDTHLGALCQCSGAFGRSPKAPTTAKERFQALEGAYRHLKNANKCIAAFEIIQTPR
eukprot:15464991-Alexandrium_andersonii.AAC.1